MSNNITIAPGVLLVRPAIRDRDTGSVLIQVADNSMPQAEVVLFGGVPAHLKDADGSYPLQINVGDTVYYTRIGAGDVPVGDEDLKAIHLQDVVAVKPR